MKVTKHSLSIKGWSDEEINKTMKILELAKKKKHPKIFMLDKLVYWIALVLIIFGNFAFSTFIIPLLVIINNLTLYLIILLLASSFGIIMSVLVRDIDFLEIKHHLILYLLVAIVGLINFLVVVNISNNNPLADSLNTYHNPIIVGLIYLIGFFIPFTYFLFEEKWMKQH
ncbi:MAG: hypothetical protein KKF89_01615 [Nanoarchaeota archaeon]|nr:hypothetical protein [Nanoarchaeota archaeon]MBU1854394.1 hypothetical protein [Nanoarchaeota archaeon]